MTKLLEKAIAKAKELPEDQQDEVAELVLNYVSGGDPYQFSNEQIEGIKKAQAAMRRGEFASDEDVAALKRRHGL